MKIFFFVLYLCIFPVVSSWAQADKEKLLKYYSHFLTEKYMAQLRKLKIVENTSNHVSDFEAKLALVKEGNGDYIQASLCVAATFSNLSFEELQIVLTKIDNHLQNFPQKVPCKGNMASITLAKLNEIYSGLKQNKTFKNDHPNGFCFDRSYLISKKLDDLGYKSRQLFIDDFVVAAYEIKGGYQGESYPIHVANVISVNVNNKVEDYVIDPMYISQPMPLNEYKKLVLIKDNPDRYHFWPQDFNTGREERKTNECYYTDYNLQETSYNIERSHSQEKIKDQDLDLKSTPEEAITSFKRKHL